MAKVQLRATQMVRVREGGRLTTYHPGDWFSVGKHIARQLLASGQASMPGTEEARRFIAGNLSDAMIVVVGGDLSEAKPILQQYGENGLSAEEAEFPALVRSRNLIWHPSYTMLPIRAVMGLARVESVRPDAITWEVAAMVRTGKLLASQVGSEEDRSGTSAIVGDLRLPVYEHKAVWVRDTNETRLMVARWRGELKQGTGPEHALLRALYTNPVRLCHLPERWLDQWIEV